MNNGNLGGYAIEEADAPVGGLDRKGGQKIIGING